MNYRSLLVLVGSAVLLSGEANAQPADYYYQRAVVGPGGGVSVAQRSGVAVPGPFGTTATTSRSGYAVTPGGGTVGYAERSGAVVGPLGGVRAGSASYVRAGYPNSSVAYSRYSRSPLPVGPVGGVAVTRTTAAAVGPFGAADYLPPVELPPEQTSDYDYERTIVGPDVGHAVERGSGSAVAGPFGAASSRTRSGYEVNPSGGTVEYEHRSGSVVGPLGGTRSSSASYVHAENADRSVTYSYYGRRSLGVGPSDPLGIARSMAATGPFGSVGYRRTGVYIGP
jgi:hypothetical protein